ncbi:hypothetical protein M0L20_02620 [Spirosoma sp. RP8]|uniref:Uncharacterized protein n=1 Tax=Spirosoma liriopis TaxID=2937440 RepID=A0ABT0HEZ1_9BACT|nr:hypothetical protein [Spirosoma liriopis]MCK8490728.1 hypothetical protein [Spirosoma liriopis]
MARQLISSRAMMLSLLLLSTLLWLYRGSLFAKELDSTDIIMMRKGRTMDGYGFLYVGVKNVSKGRPSQYRDFLPNVAANIADTIRENINIYFLTYDRQIEQYTHNWTPFKLEEEVPDAFLLREHWNGGKKPTFVHWYIPSLKPLNTEVPDLLHLEDTKVEQVK